ncbi:MAG: 23S rRNA (adenine(2503)-C(2))-methyltransferase RlmN [Synergistaceae bacterium]|nr:23S rRNA (adenine(2503)-C(2))-methyltransferase RlmN [Synergistota bacterium]NLM71451.1 23S rRNA (adenine(2503)-C(2))-methyltransferase RlmN [Synergistaceae bacterium]
MSETVNALDLSYEEWVEACVSRWGLPKYRADQLCQWIYGKKVFNVHEMTNLSKELRERLAYELLVLPPITVREDESKDGTRKFLFQLYDGEQVEAVMIPQGSHTTACISSQAGCPLSCSFCATGRSGFSRDLTTGEIVGQFLAMEKRLGRNIENVVYMGMGEPLLNTAAVFKSIENLHSPKMRNLGARHITISTCGIVPGILELADFYIPVRLSVSLHAPNDSLRSKIMPVNRKYSVGALVDAMRTYWQRTGERITVEYVMLQKVNDEPDHAYETAALLSGLSVYVNLIPYNPVPPSHPGDPVYARSSAGRVKEFSAILTKLGIENEIRRERGKDIDAACGQLRARNRAKRGGEAR